MVALFSVISGALCIMENDLAVVCIESLQDKTFRCLMTRLYSLRCNAMEIVVLEVRLAMNRSGLTQVSSTGPDSSQ